MPLISIKDLSVGQTLTADARGPGGRLIVAAGTEITKTDLRALKTWNVRQVSVGNETSPNERRPSSGDSARLASLCSKFSLNDPEHPLIAKLMDLALEKS